MISPPESKVSIHSIPQPLWHQLPLSIIFDRLATNPDLGLTTDEIAKRHREFGLNELVGKKGKPGWLKFILQFNQPLLIILVCAGAIKALLGEWLNAGVIWGVTTTNAIISYFQEAQAEEAIASLANSIVTEATVVRNGRKTKVPSSQLVPGDIVLLASGDKVPADLRLFKTRDLQIDESALTGESVAVEKEVAATNEGGLEAETPLAERSNMAYAGGFVTFGQGTGIVIATGNLTETGKISSLIEQRADLTTPLTRKFNQFSQNWLFFVLGMATLTFAVGLGQRSFKDAVEAAVALIVGAIPEGLPAVMTVTLAIGVRRMARHHAIIRKLPAVETLGSATVICSDKTGTLTENQMTVQEIYAGGLSYSLTGQGYNPDGAILQGTGTDTTPQIAPNTALQACLLTGLLCNDSQLEQQAGKWVVVGDPTEGAMITAALKAGLSRADVARQPRLDTIPFESQFQYMASLHADGDGRHIIYVKGAAEALLPRCVARLEADDNLVALDRLAIEDRIDAMAEQGLRVLAFAKKIVSVEQQSVNHPDLAADLVFLGLEGLIDPPRPAAIAAVHSCQAAGIQVKMITGDHLKTATAIARRMGIRNKDKQVIAYSGAELAQMHLSELANAVNEGAVFARVAPEQKLRLVEALQSRGEIVAMTGDGVNDAPALKQADIGIAMGSGTEVSKQAADMILTDDNFASIVAAVEEGRSVYQNLIKAICFILPVNGGESMTILISTLLGRELPILSLQILWLNMLNSIAMTVPLAFEPKSVGLMKHPPRPANEQFLTINRIKRILAVSLYNWTLIFGMFEWVQQAPGGSLELARTMAIQALVMGRMIYLLSISQLLPSLIAKLSGSTDRVKGAPALAIGLVVAIVLQIIFTNSPLINSVFETAPMSLNQWSICIGASLPMIAIATIANRFDPPNS
jgi:cation-transporting P-type ATPase F